MSNVSNLLTEQIFKNIIYYVIQMYFIQHASYLLIYIDSVGIFDTIELYSKYRVSQRKPCSKIKIMSLCWDTR